LTVFPKRDYNNDKKIKKFFQHRKEKKMNHTICKKCFAALLAAGTIVFALPFVGAADKTPDTMNADQQPTTIHFSSVAEEIVNEDGSVTLAFGKDVGEKIVNEDGSVTLAFGNHAGKKKANETPDETNEERQPTAVHFYNVAEKTVNEDGSVTLSFGNLTVQGEEVPKPEKDNISISNGGSARQFAKVKLNNSISNSMTFTMDNLVYQPYQNIIIEGACDKAGVKLHFELYRYVNQCH